MQLFSYNRSTIAFFTGNRPPASISGMTTQAKFSGKCQNSKLGSVALVISLCKEATLLD